jgi:anthranilate phosphoribosyltransferase
VNLLVSGSYYVANSFSDILTRVIAREDLAFDQSAWAFGQIMDGQWSESQVAALVTALAAKGETADEIAGAAQAMRQHVLRIDAGPDVIDTCGTGGTALPTFNISTAAALVAAGAGARVAKHGNRTSTRASGSADVLAALGVNIDCDAALAARCLREAGVCFCYALRCHPAMRHAAPVRKALGVRTIFNLLGPLTNPGGATRQLMGVFDDALTDKIARVLATLGTRRAMVVHADDGLDELSTTAPTRISELHDGRITTSHARPEDFGLPRAKLADLIVDSPAASAQAIRAILAGEPGPRRDIVVLNAAAALCVAGIVPDVATGIPAAAKSIDSGSAATALERLIFISNS